MRQFKRVTATAVTITMAGVVASAAMPAVASAKHSKGLTRSQVIALIKHYERPGPAGPAGAKGDVGPQGPKGDTGPAGSYTIGSGLKATGNTLSLDFGAFAQCGAYQFMIAVQPSGTPACRYEPTSDFWAAFAGFASGSAGATSPPTGVPLTNTYTAVMSGQPVTVPGPHMVTAVVQLGTDQSAGTTDLCQLDLARNGTLTPLQTESTALPPLAGGVTGSSTLYFQALANAQVSDGYVVDCKVLDPSGGTGGAGGSIFTYLANN